jgi:arylsulfatase A-like enzyme
MNFIVITVDALRYDFIGANGNDEIQTPNLDRVGRRNTVYGIRYEAVVSERTPLA